MPTSLVPDRLALALLAALTATVAQAGPVPVVTACRVIDSCGAGGPAGGNGLLDPGEEATLILRVENRGSSPATNLRALIAPADPGVTITTDTTTFPDLAPGASAEGSATVHIQLDRSATCGSVLPFDVTLAFNGTIRPDRCEVQVPPDCFACGADACDARYLVPWSAGPYGTNLYDTAADGVLPTLEGGFTLSTAWNGCESVVFVIRYPTDPADPGNGFVTYTQQLWNSSVGNLISASPRNVQYVFMSADRNPANVLADVNAMQARVQAAISRLSPADQAEWRPRFHHVTTGAYDLGNWMSAMLAAHGQPAWCIDRFQRIRQVGLLYAVGASSTPELDFLAHEVRHFNFERERQRQLDWERHDDIVLWQGDTLSGGVDVDVTFPDAAAMAHYDTMLFDLGFECTNPWDSRSCEWDYLANLYLCDPADPASCGQEFGRWITAYGRGGRWVTDMTPFMALIADGGPRRLRFVAPQTYVTRLVIRLANRGKGVRPAEATWLYGGGGFNQDYNAGHPPMRFEVPPYARREDVAALITGHGWGAEVANCAEFCNHQHRFTINGTAFEKDHAMAGTSTGCIDQIESGTVPNQYGTWPYGRGGWCPGLDVPAWDADVTAAVHPGWNDLVYEGLYRNAVYVPQPSGSGQGFGARIDMSSYAVTYIETAEADCADGLDDDGDGRADCADQGCWSQPACATADTDGDGTANAADCSPLDGGVVLAPAGLGRLDVVKTAGVATIAWPALALAAGASTTCDVATGLVSEMRADRGLARPTCLARAAAGGSVADARAVPGAQDAFWYVLSARNRCGAEPFSQPELVATPPCN